MKVLSKSLAAMVAAATLVGGGAFAVAGTAYAADNDAITVTPNPWYANSFDGWGTSLAWFANATGSLGEESAITTNLGDDASKAKAVEYGKQLREQFYQSIFGDEGLDLNMARYNVGGGNASDVAYGYPFMRQGAAVPGTWKDDATGSGTYGNGVTTKQADKDKLAAAFDPTDDNQYDFSKSAAQDWWIERGATGDNPDITDVEAFANSAPWFLTNSGYATGGYNSGSNNLANPEKFAQYMAKNVEHLESLGANVDTVEPFNESETSYWGTPGDMASKYTDESDDNTKLINNYWDKYYSDKDRSVTPYSNALKKPQEGMHVSNAQQQQTITALAEALKDNDDTIIAATDATNSADFVKSYNQYPQAIKDLIGQYNVHAYSDSNQMQSRDIAQADGKKLSMSEVDGSWQSGSYNPYGFDNALGMMSKISSNVTRLQSKDFTFWQVVEDLYNMQMGSNVNPAGENTNWGTVLIDFDCTVAGDLVLNGVLVYLQGGFCMSMNISGLGNAYSGVNTNSKQYKALKEKGWLEGVIQNEAMMSPEEKMIYEIFGGRDTIVNNLMKQFDSDGDLLNANGVAGMDVTGKGTSWQKLTNVSEEYRQKMFDNVKKEFIQENGVSNGDTTKRSDIFKDYQLSVNKDKRLSGTWTLEQYEGQYRSAMYAAVKAANPNWKPGQKFDTSILDNVTRESVEATLVKNGNRLVRNSIDVSV